MNNTMGYGDVAQLVAHLNGIQKVRGSNPLVSTGGSVQDTESAWHARRTCCASL